MLIITDNFNQILPASARLRKGINSFTMTCRALSAVEAQALVRNSNNTKLQLQLLPCPFAVPEFPKVSAQSDYSVGIEYLFIRAMPKLEYFHIRTVSFLPETNTNTNAPHSPLEDL